MSQTYRSTRSVSEETSSFEETIMTGLAKDGGLFVPSEIPKLPANFLQDWANLSFEELAFNIMKLYISEDEIPHADLQQLIEKSYKSFRSDKVTPLVPINDKIHLLELFHGPTYAFKDVALQFVGNLFEYFLTRKNEGKTGTDRDILTVVGATSGDTGSAAIYGLRNKKDVSVFILYPTGRISPVQELQMTTVADDNIHTLSVNGTFDDCQDLVKQVFSDKDFNGKYHVGAVNSINWARILAQMTYYFHAYFQLKAQNLKVKFVVPSGNFGDILSGFYAKKMGLPIDELVIATNENDILDRFLKSGKYDREDSVKATYSPAMDIAVSSNFERFLWYMVRATDAEEKDTKAGEILNSFMSQLKSQGVFPVSEATLQACRNNFSSHRVSNQETVDTIKQVYESTPNNYIMDPHTAVGIATSLLRSAAVTDETVKFVSLSTAHPAKFSEVVNLALSSFDKYDFESQVLPQQFKEFSTLPQKIRKVEDASLKTIESVIVEELAKEQKV